MKDVTMVDDEEGGQAVEERIEEHFDHMTKEDWDRVFENLRKSKPPQ